MANGILMQKGTALWLAKRTNLSNKQIADFCNLHEIEVNAFRMGLDQNIIETNPVDMMLLSEEMIKKCENDANAKLEANTLDMKVVGVRKSRSYMKRHEIVNAIFWLMTKQPDLPNEAIVKLLKCTKTLVQSIRDKSYKDYENLTPRHPVVLELCTQEDLDKLLVKYEQKRS